MGAEKSGGNAARTICSARIPPADAPMATARHARGMSATGVCGTACMLTNEFPIIVGPAILDVKRTAYAILRVPAAMKDQDKIVTFLQEHVGFHFCSFCLSRDVGIDSFVARNVVWELQASPGYQMRTTKCVSCVRSKRVIAAVSGFALLGPEAHVVAFLLGNKGLTFCNACLAFANEISLEDAERVATYLEPLPEFERLAAGECSVCGRSTKPVLSAVPSVGAEHGANHDSNGLASVDSTITHYRGWRIDLLSYRVQTGWRPFIVIHGPEKSVVPEAATLWDPVPTKAEADEFAVARAKDWIDKRF